MPDLNDGHPALAVILDLISKAVRTGDYPDPAACDSALRSLSGALGPCSEGVIANFDLTQCLDLKGKPVLVAGTVSSSRGRVVLVVRDAEHGFHRVTWSMAGHLKSFSFGDANTLGRKHSIPHGWGDGNSLEVESTSARRIIPFMNLSLFIRAYPGLAEPVYYIKDLCPTVVYQTSPTRVEEAKGGDQRSAREVYSSADGIVQLIGVADEEPWVVTRSNCLPHPTVEEQARQDWVLHWRGMNINACDLVPGSVSSPRKGVIRFMRGEKSLARSVQIVTAEVGKKMYEISGSVPEAWQDFRPYAVNGRIYLVRGSPDRRLLVDEYVEGPGFVTIGVIAPRGSDTRAFTIERILPINDMDTVVMHSCPNNERLAVAAMRRAADGRIVQDDLAMVPRGTKLSAFGPCGFMTRDEEDGVRCWVRMESGQWKASKPFYAYGVSDTLVPVRCGDGWYLLGYALVEGTLHILRRKIF